MAFFLSPSQAVQLDDNDRYDFLQEDARNLYSRATKSLYPKNEYYDCDPEEMFTLLQLLAHRADEVKWTEQPEGILWIPEDTNDIENADIENLLENYGSIELETIQQWEDYFTSQEDFRAQQDYMLFQCLMNTMSLKSKNQLQLKEEDYIRGGNRHGLSLLKTILGESHLDTNATTMSIRERISNLDEYILKVDCDIKKFHEHVKRLVSSLQARKENSSDLITNLFKAYKAVKDESFASHMERKESDYEDGRSYSYTELMTIAENRYKALVLKDKWCAPSATDEKILAMQAKLAENAKELKQVKKSKATPKGKGGGGDKREANRKETEPKWKAKNLPPKKSELTKTRRYKDKDWRWCSSETGGKCSGKWVVHSAKDCIGNEFDPKKRKTESKKEGPKMKLKKAYQAIADTGDASSSDEE